MRLGVLLLPTDPWPEAAERARELEAMGYHHLWTYDHLSWRRYRERPWFAALPWLTGVAAATSRIRLGTMVATPGYRHPVTFAKEVMTLDHISGGRFIAGVGAGGVGFDATVLGGSVPTPAQRVERLAEFVSGLDRLLREPESSFEGVYYSAQGAMMVPGCVQKPRLPIAIGAGGPRTLRLAAQYADAWITYGDPNYADTTPEGTARAVRYQAGLLDRYCAEIGRDPAEIDRIYLIGNTDERPLASVAAFVDFAGRYGELGFTDIVFHHPRPDDPVWTEDPAVVAGIAAELLT